MINYNIFVHTGNSIDSTSLKFVCDRCLRNYGHKQSLIRHQRFECGISPKFSCPKCTYKAKQKVSLIKHMAFKHVNVEFQ